MLRKQRERSAAGRRSSFTYKGRTIEKAQIERYLKRAKISDDDLLDAVDAPTPSELVYRTPSPTDTAFGEYVDHPANADKSLIEPGFTGAYSEVGSADTESTKERSSESQWTK